MSLHAGSVGCLLAVFGIGPQRTVLSCHCRAASCTQLLSGSRTRTTVVCQPTTSVWMRLSQQRSKVLDTASVSSLLPCSEVRAGPGSCQRGICGNVVAWVGCRRQQLPLPPPACKAKQGATTHGEQAAKQFLSQPGTQTQTVASASGWFADLACLQQSCISWSHWQRCGPLFSSKQQHGMHALVGCSCVAAQGAADQVCRLHIQFVGQVLTSLLLTAAANAGILSPGFSTGCVCLGQSSSITRQQDVSTAAVWSAAHLARPCVSAGCLPWHPVLQGLSGNDSHAALQRIGGDKQQLLQHPPCFVTSCSGCSTVSMLSVLAVQCAECPPPQHTVTALHAAM